MCDSFPIAAACCSSAAALLLLLLCCLLLLCLSLVRPWHGGWMGASRMKFVGLPSFLPACLAACLPACLHVGLAEWAVLCYLEHMLSRLVTALFRFEYHWVEKWYGYVPSLCWIQGGFT